jgi:uncharacterized membrane protein YfcA
MLLTAILLSVVIGVTLGLLGGGGSILTVPILVYVLGVGTKEAIATSLLVVGVTSAVGALQHARAGNVRAKTGLVFGVVAMVGAYGGGFAAGYLSGTTLLLAFAALMVSTGVAMMRKSKKDSSPPADADEPHEERPFSLAKVIAQGLTVGAVTGLVGAGGGFLVVPALVLLGGLGMRAAIGTSLMVIALNSFAGLAGHLTHVSIDLKLAAIVTTAAALGSIGGVQLAKRIDAGKLRKGFAAFVLAMAAFVIYREAPASVLQSLLVEHWQLWAAGATLATLGLLWFLRPQSLRRAAC